MGIIKRKKYEFTGKTKVITQFGKSHTLYQIKALKDVYLESDDFELIVF